MKALNPIRLALLGAAALFTHAAFAAGGPKPPPPPQPSSGTLVLTYPDAFNWGLAAAPSGTVYAVGNNHPIPGIAGGSQLVLGTSDTGDSWSVLDDFAPPGRYVDFFGWADLGGGITSDPADNLYVSGLSYPDELSNAEAQWYVRRSTDGGVSWTSVDNLVKAPPDANADDIGIAADAAGNVYASACDFYWTGSNYRDLWTVRKGIGGTSFSTVDTVPNSRPTDIFVHPTAGIFVAGMTTITIKNQTCSAWLVRRSTDGGATWSNVDTFQLSSSKSSVAMGIAANSSGIYVVGQGYNINRGVTSSHWIVRKSTNGGNSWTTVDDYQLIADNSSQARCIAKDASGNLVVAGSGAGKWIVRKSAGGTSPWTTVDVFQNGSAVTTPNAIAADVFGNVFVGGNDGVNWLIKVLIRQNRFHASIMKTSGTLAAKHSEDLFGVHPSGCALRSITLKRAHRTALSLFCVAALTITSLLPFWRPSAHAQGGVPLWTNRSESGIVWAIAVDSSGNLFVAGESVIKYSNAGVPLWTNRLGGRAIALDSTGNVFVTGSSLNGGNEDFQTIKYSNAGLPLWTNIYDGPGSFNDRPSSIAVDLAGNAIVTGNSRPNPSSPPFADSDYATVGYSNAGVPLWTNRYEAHNLYDNSPPRIALDSSGTVFVTGSSWSGSDATTSDYLTVAYSSTGDLLWINRYDAANQVDRANAIAVDSAGNVVVTGESVGSSGRNDYATIAYSNEGVPLWTNRYAGGVSGSATAIVCDSSGNVFVTGTSYSTSGTGDSDYATIKYSNSGVPLWTRRYSGPAYFTEYARAIALDTNGNVFVTGQSAAFNSAYDYTTVAYSSAGVPLWTKRYDGQANDEDSARAIAVDRGGNVFVAGESWNGIAWEGVTIKYSSSVPLPRLDFQKMNNQLVLSWTNAGFNLQTAPALTGPFTNLPAATSPHTNSLTAPQQFFRLISN